MDWIATVVVFFLGLVSALGLEFGRSQIERHQRRSDRANEFQRDTLLELQGAMYHFVQAAASIVQEYRDVVAGRVPGSLLRGEQPGKMALIAQFQIVMLAVRIQDEPLRKLVDQYKDVFRESYFKASTAEEADAALQQVQDIFNRANDLIGERLREL